MTAFGPWTDQADALLGAIELDPEAPSAVSALAAKARVIWPGLVADERTAVLDRLGRLGARLTRQMQAIDDELSASAHRKASIRGYGQLRGSHRGQRLRRRA